MNDAFLTFIGGGNMAGSLVGGLISDGWDPARIRVADADPEARERMAARHQVNTTPDNAAAISDANVVVLAVKPQIMQDVAGDLSAALAQQQPLVISIAAGIRAATLRDWLGKDTAIVRAMPNTPALVQSGASALYANTVVTDEQRSLAESILRAVGLAIWAEDEDQMDAVTALSGSGPAYFFLFMEAMQTAGTELGLPAETARLLALQ
ncbi:MAG: pyrroline-5-carboxylate reductase, partial [Gammaproteobacteria bacterium]|nr:pyrroline-5-carboxylate reductase [Gammaproteobacteria bacterium]